MKFAQLGMVQREAIKLAIQVLFQTVELVGVRPHREQIPLLQVMTKIYLREQERAKD